MAMAPAISAMPTATTTVVSSPGGGEVDDVFTPWRKSSIWVCPATLLAAGGGDGATVARQEAAPRRLSVQSESTTLAPQLGEAWWSLANLKTFRFEPSDVEAMQGQLRRTDIAHEDRFHLHFALGKALEDAGRYEESFGHYAEANRLRREAIHYHADDTSALVRRSKSVLTREFFAARAGSGCEAPDPIFVVGLPRAGSTLIEQVLASHPAVEGIMAWVFWAGNSWRGPNGGLAKRDWTLNEASKRFEALMAEWSTNVSGSTDLTGIFAFRGFHGDYSVTRGAFRQACLLLRSHPEPLSFSFELRSRLRERKQRAGNYQNQAESSSCHVVLRVILIIRIAGRKSTFKPVWFWNFRQNIPRDQSNRLRYSMNSRLRNIPLRS